MPRHAPLSKKLSGLSELNAPSGVSELASLTVTSVCDAAATTTPTAETLGVTCTGLLAIYWLLQIVQTLVWPLCALFLGMLALVPGFMTGVLKEIVPTSLQRFCHNFRNIPRSYASIPSYVPATDTQKPKMDNASHAERRRGRFRSDLTRGGRGAAGAKIAPWATAAAARCRRGSSHRVLPTAASTRSPPTTTCCTASPLCSCASHSLWAWMPLKAKMRQSGNADMKCRSPSRRLLSSSPVAHRPPGRRAARAVGQDTSAGWTAVIFPPTLTQTTMIQKLMSRHDVAAGVGAEPRAVGDAGLAGARGRRCAGAGAARLLVAARRPRRLPRGALRLRLVPHPQPFPQ